MTSLRPVPEATPRVLALVRVSKEREGLVSPEVQRVSITDYCARRGYEIVGWAEGIDESGSRARSAWWPRLDQAVAAVEAGEYDVLVVWKFSRTARHRLRWAVALDRVEQAGGRLESATEQIDVSTSAGRFTRGMFGEMAAFEAERIGEGWKEAHATRVRSGKPANGKPRYGYAYDTEQKLHVPDPETGPVLADVYRRYVAGETVYGLVRWLNAHGWRTTAGRLWSDRSLRRVMDSGFASGRFAAGGELHAGVHEPLIDDALWTAYLDARAGRRARPARVERSQYLLSGLVKCARCRGSMVAGQYGSGRAPKYRCTRGKEQGAAGCIGGYVMASFVEARVLEWLEELAEDVETAAGAKAAAVARRTTAASEEARLARELARAEDALGRVALQNAQTPLPASVYRRVHGELSEQVAQLEAALEDAGRAGRAVAVDPAAVAAGLLESWHESPVEHRREVLRSIVSGVWVTTGRPRAVVEVRKAWEES